MNRQNPKTDGKSKSKQTKITQRNIYTNTHSEKEKKKKEKRKRATKPINKQTNENNH